MFELDQWHGLSLMTVFECLLLMTVICLIVGVRWGRRSILIAALFFATAAWAANTTLANLSAASSVGAGDLFYDVQTPTVGGVKATAAQVAAYVRGTLGTSAGSWTPADTSGASLTFSAVNAGYTQIGNMVFAYATIHYPVTVDGSNTRISGLPVAVPNQTYAQQCNTSFSGALFVNGAFTLANTSTLGFVNNSTGSQATNADVSDSTIGFICIYPAT